MKRIIFLLGTALLFFTATARSDVVLTLMVGKVSVKHEGTDKFVSVKANTALKSGDMIQVGDKSKAVVKFSDGSTYIVSTPRVFKVADVESQKAANSGKKINQLLRKKAAKLVSKDHGGDVTAVAGVRGADVDKQKKKADADRINWK